MNTLGICWLNVIYIYQKCSVYALSRCILWFLTHGSADINGDPQEDSWHKVALYAKHMVYNCNWQMVHCNIVGRVAQSV